MNLTSLLAGIAALTLPLAVGAAGDGPVLVLGAPGAAAAEIVARADGALLRGTALSWITLARSDAPDFAGRLRRAGAWLVLRVPGLDGCSSGQFRSRDQRRS